MIEDLLRPSRADRRSLPMILSRWRRAMSSVMIRVTPDNFETWRRAHESCHELRRGFAVTDERIYRDLEDEGTALVELETSDIARTMAWFSSTEFAAASLGISVRHRVVYIAEL